MNAPLSISTKLPGKRVVVSRYVQTGLIGSDNEPAWEHEIYEKGKFLGTVKQKCSFGAGVEYHIGAIRDVTGVKPRKIEDLVTSNESANIVTGFHRDTVRKTYRYVALGAFIGFAFYHLVRFAWSFL